MTLQKWGHEPPSFGQRPHFLRVIETPGCANGQVDSNFESALSATVPSRRPPKSGVRVGILTHPKSTRKRATTIQ